MEAYDLNLGMQRAEDRIDPWSFPLRIDGKEFETRAPSINDLAAIDRIGQMKEADRVALVMSLFVGDAPPVSTWDLTKVQAFAVAMVTAFTERVKKKSQRLSSDVAAWIGSGSKS